MKNLFAAGFIVLTFSYNSFARWGFVSLDELVRDSDLIIVGTLQSISEFTENNVDYGEGFILVEKVIFRSAESHNGFSFNPKDKLQLKWENNSFVACPRISHKHSKNKKEIWLLTLESDGTVRANYPGRSRSLDDLSEIKRLLENLNKFEEVSKATSDNQITLQTNSTINNDLSISNGVVKVSSSKQFSILNALVTALFSIGLYWILYRSRFKIR